MSNYNYIPYPVPLKFHQDTTAFVRALCGPFGCVSHDTEYLTPTGWKKIEDYDGEDISVWDSNTGKVFFEKPYKRTKTRNSGLTKIKINKGPQQCTSRYHDVPTMVDGELKVVSTQTILNGNAKGHVITTFETDNNKYNIALDVIVAYSEKDLGADILEYKVKDVKSLRYIRGVLSKCGISSNIRYLSVGYSVTFNYDQKKPNRLSDLKNKWYLSNSDQYRIALTILSEHVNFYNCSQTEMDMIQFAYHAIGINYPIRRRIMVDEEQFILTPDNITHEKYEHKYKYCFETPTQFWVSRYKGDIVITGNSGKSVACVQELLYIAIRQTPNEKGERKTRFGIIRATYPNLRTTTKKTIEKWFPEECGRIKETAPMQGTYRIPLPDNTVAIVELLLLAIENDADVSKLRSTDFTAIWINEATEVSYDVLSAATGRVGRYPTGTDGSVTHSCIIMDYNKPPIGHWLYEQMESAKKPDDYAYYEQPPAAFKEETEDGIIIYHPNPNADNLAVLGGGDIEKGMQYYVRQINTYKANDSFDLIDQLFCLKPVHAKLGKPVWPSFDMNFHVSKSPINPVPNVETLIGIDTSGIHPAAVILQMMGRRWVVTDELYGEEMGFEEFRDSVLVPVLRTRYPGVEPLSICDPNNARDGFTAMTPVAHLNDVGIRARVAVTNDPKKRIEAVSKILNRVAGGLLVSSHCLRLIAAMAGGYRYAKLRVHGTVNSMYSKTPVKDDHSHPADALQYAVLHIVQEESDGVVDSQIQEIMSKRLNRR